MVYFQYEIKPWGYVMSKHENKNPKFDQGYIDYKHKIQKELNIIRRICKAFNIHNNKSNKPSAFPSNTVRGVICEKVGDIDGYINIIYRMPIDTW